MLAVSAGVAVFTLYPSQPKAVRAPRPGEEEKNVVWGMGLLACNLLFDGLTNTIQDDIFVSSPKGSVSGPQMMAALNTLSSVLTSAYLVLNPWSTELREAAAFVAEHPKVGLDILGFAFCGAVGQVFICESLVLGAADGDAANIGGSLYAGKVWVVGFGYRYRDAQDAVDGFLGRGVWSQLVGDAGAGRGHGVQRDWRRGRGEAAERGGKEEEFSGERRCKEGVGRHVEQAGLAARRLESRLEQPHTSARQT